MYKKGEAHSSTSEPVGQAWYSAQYDKMSYYYNYTIGYMTADKKVYPFGPYNSNGKLKDVVSKSASFASDLHEAFWPVNDDMITDELKKDFEYESWNDEMEMPDIRYLKFSDLPSDDFVKKGYFLVEDVKNYEEDQYDFDGFYDSVTPIVYASMLQKEMMFGKPKAEKDEEGYEYTPKAASDYMYYAYPDYNSKEYEVFMIKQVGFILKEYREIPEDAVLVVLETEG